MAIFLPALPSFHVTILILPYGKKLQCVLVQIYTKIFCLYLIKIREYYRTLFIIDKCCLVQLAIMIQYYIILLNLLKVNVFSLFFLYKSHCFIPLFSVDLLYKRLIQKLFAHFPCWYLFPIPFKIYPHFHTIFTLYFST